MEEAGRAISRLQMHDSREQVRFGDETRGPAARYRRRKVIDKCGEDNASICVDGRPNLNAFCQSGWIAHRGGRAEANDRRAQGSPGSRQRRGREDRGEREQGADRVAAVNS